MKNKLCILIFLGLIFPVFAFALTGDSLKAVSMVKYEQNWDDVHATISVRNNTQSDIKDLAFRITYLDMKGNSLDYKNFSQTISIAPGMTKAIDISAFESSRYYSYYKSEPYPITPHRFKVKFELVGFNKVKEKAVDNQPVDEDSFYNSNGSPRCLSPYVLLIPLLLVVVVLGAYVGLYILVAVMAQKRNRSVVGWILLSLIATPLLMVILLLVLGKSENSGRDIID